MMKLKFANREAELDQICKPSPDPLVVIDAPYGYGKSFLLEEIRGRYTQDQWECALIRLNEVKGKPAIRNAIADQIGTDRTEITHDDDEADAELRHHLAGIGRVFLLFDAEERANPEDLNWLLTSLIPGCLKGLTGLHFRVIFAGRYVQARDRYPKYIGYQCISLGPFNRTAIQQVLEDVAHQCPPDGREVTREYIAAWSESIMRLSGGHPKCIERLVATLVESNWSLPVSPAEEQRLFKKCVDPEVKELTGSLDDTTRSALEVLSIFREFSLNTIKALQQRNRLPTDIDALDILTKLTSIGLVAKPPSRLLYSDEIVSQFILARMKIFEPSRYQDLNRVAQEIYDRWIQYLMDNPDNTFLALSPHDLVQFCVRESIYHDCQQLASKTAIGRLTTHLEKHSLALTRVMGDDKSDPGRRKLLENIMMSDKDILSKKYELTVRTFFDFAFGQNGVNYNTEGEQLMPTEPLPKSNLSLGDWLVDVLDLLRHNAQNVLIERWEKRNIGHAVTPPVFEGKEYTREELRRSLPKEEDIRAKLTTYRNPDDKTVIVTEQHIRNLHGQMVTAQESVDRFGTALAKPLSESDKIVLESQRDEYQEGIEQALNELADILAFIYSK